MNWPFDKQPNMSFSSCRETDRLQERRLEEAEGEAAEEDPQRLGGGLRRLLGKIRLHQADRGGQAQTCPGRAVIILQPSLGNSSPH